MQAHCPIGCDGCDDDQPVRTTRGYLPISPLREIVGRWNRREVNRLLAGRDRRHRIAGRGQHATDEQVHLIVEDQLLRLKHADRGLGLVILDDELYAGPGEVVLRRLEVHFKAADHVLADLGERPGHRCNESDAQLFRLRREKTGAEQECSAQ